MSYLIFAYDDYYPQGGWYDFKDSHQDKRAAIEIAKAYTNEPRRYDVVCVVQLSTLQIVWRNDDDQA